MNNHKHKVSIGLPVFNGEEYIEQALKSILLQTYTDFELIISDNASTDRTQHICQAYAKKDKRIRYYRNAKNLGASMNFNRVFKLSHGKYFKWAAHDDVLAPEFLEKCVSVLDQNFSVVLCHSKIGRINEHGALSGTYEYNLKLDSKKLHERFRDLLDFNFRTDIIFGLIRASALKMTHLMGGYIGSDRNLLAEIGLIGRIYEVPEYLFLRRDHPNAYSKTVFKNYSERRSWWTEAYPINFPFQKNSLEYFASIRRIPLKSSERLLCYAQIAKWIINEGGVMMLGDLLNLYLDILSCTNLGFITTQAIKRIWMRTMSTINKRKTIPVHNI